MKKKLKKRNVTEELSLHILFAEEDSVNDYCDNIGVCNHTTNPVGC